MPEQIAKLSDVERFGGKILASNAVGLHVAQAPAQIGAPSSTHVVPEGKAIKPTPESPRKTPRKIKEKPPTLLDLFNKDFPGVVSFTDKGFDLNGSDGRTVHVNWRVLANFPSKSEFVAFYIPAVNDEVAACLALADSVHPVIDGLSQHMQATGGYSGEVTTLRDLTFSGRVFIYHEWPLSNKQKADIVEAYSAKGLDVQFRGIDYLATHVIAWHHEHDK